MSLPKCPGCGSKATRDDSITKGVEGAVRCTECSFAALITDWEQLASQKTRLDEERILELAQQVRGEVDVVVVAEKLNGGVK